MKNFKPKDIIALATVMFVFILKLNNIDGNADTVLALILGYYFVKRQNGTDKGT